MQVGWTAGAAYPDTTDLPAYKEVILPHYTQFYGGKTAAEQDQEERKVQYGRN